MRKIFLIAGDPSGDLIAAKLVQSLRKQEPNLQVTSLGGDNLEKVSDRFLGNIVKQHALGFAITPKKILFFKNILNNVVIPEIEKNNPDAVVPVDFYGFNSRVACAAKKRGKKVFYYVSPQFWASRPGRAESLRGKVDLFLCLFPFEEEFYRKKNLPVQFVGHPLIDALPDMAGAAQKRVEVNIGLLPGSRPEEIRRHLPVMLETADRLFKETPQIRLFLFAVPHVDREFYHDIVSQFKKSSIMLDLVLDENYQWRSQMDLAMTASGMETLENALLGIPMVIMYKTNWPTYVIARCLIRIKFLGMPNLLAGRPVSPEFIQWNAKPENIAGPLLQWLKDPAAREKVRQDLLSMREKFGDGGASDRAARAILGKVA